MSSSYRNRINKLLSQLSVGSGIELGKRRSTRARGGLFEFLESRQLLSVTTVDTTIAGPLSHAAFNFANVTFQVSNGTLNEIEFTTLPPNGTLQLGNVTVTVNQGIPITQLADLTYTPNSGFGGADIGQWDGSDDLGGSFSGAPANLTLNVNHQPTLSTITASVVHDHPLTFALSKFTSAFTDADSNALSNVTFITLPSNASSFTFNGTPIHVGDSHTAAELSTGILLYVPAAGYTGPDTFNWNASDGIENSVANAPLNITVTDNAPTLTNISKTGRPNVPIAIPLTSFSGAFTDADGDAVQSVTFVTLPAHGTLKLGNATVTAGQTVPATSFANLTYTSNQDYVGPDSFQWNASDGVLSAASAALANITLADARPVLSNATLQAPVTVNTTIGAQNFQSNFSDTDANDTLQQVVIKSLPAHGNLELISNGTTTNVAVNQPLSLTDLANLTYAPDSSYTATDAFAWNASDGSLFAASDATFTLSTNTAPTVTDIQVTLLTGGSHTFKTTDFDPNGDGSGQTGYQDVDGQPLASITITALPTAGMLTLSGAPVVVNQTIAAADISNLVYTTTLTVKGTDQFMWTASDGALTAATPANAGMIILDATLTTSGNLTVSTAENRPQTILGSSFQAQFGLAGQTGTAPLTKMKFVTLPAHGKLTVNNTVVTQNQTVSLSDVTYTPAAGYAGSDSFTWAGSTDGIHFSATPGTVGITVTAPTSTGFSKFFPMNIASTFSASDFTAGFSAFNSATLAAIRITILPAHGVLKLGSAIVTANQQIAAANLSFLSYTPKAGYTGADAFNWSGSDGFAFSAPVAANITVVPSLAVIGNGLVIGQNAKPSVANFTDFRNWTLAADGSMDFDIRSYTIRNSSQSTMNFSAVATFGTNANDFRIIAPSRADSHGAFSLAPGETATFQVRFLPRGTGLRSAMIALRNAAGKIVFQFGVQGTSLATRNVVTTSFDANGNRVRGLVQTATTKTGSGPALINGHIVSVQYTGYFADTGFVFDASVNHPEFKNGFEFRLDNRFKADPSLSQPFLQNNQHGALGFLGIVDNTVIPGWEYALQGIKPGETRTLVINMNAGYGPVDPSHPSDVQGKTLIFDIQCLSIDPMPSLQLASIVPTADGKSNTIFPVNSGQTATSADSRTLLSLSNTDISSSTTQDFNIFTIAPDDQNGNATANVVFDPKTPITLTGSNTPDFSISLSTNQFGPVVAVTFHPLTPGLKTVQVHIHSNDPLHRDYVFTVQGNATRYSDLSPGFDGSFNLPPKPIYTGSGQTVPVPVTITNTGDATFPNNSKTNLQIYANNNATGRLTLVGYINNINVGGLQVGGIKHFFPQDPLPLDNQSPFAPFSAGLYTFTVVVNQLTRTANSTVSGLVMLPPNGKFATMVQGAGDGVTANQTMTDNDTADSGSAPIVSKNAVNRAIEVIAGKYVLGGTLGTSTIVATPASGAHGATVNIQNLGNILTIPSQVLSIDILARPIDNSGDILLVSGYHLSPGRISVGGMLAVNVPINYNDSPRFKHNTYILLARVKLVDSAGNILAGQQVISLNGNLSGVLLNP